MVVRGSSGVRLLVEPVMGRALLLPLSRAACLRLGEAILLAATPAPSEPAPNGPPRGAKTCLWQVLLEGDSGTFLSRFPPLPSGGPEVGEEDPDAATALWLWSREARVRRAPAAAEEPATTIFPALARCIVAEGAVAGARGVADDAWDGWVAATAAGSDLAAATVARWERLRRGDWPPTADDHAFPTTPEGRTLVAAARLAAAVRDVTVHPDDRTAAARIEAIRELAYGAGHEINNPLANIATRAQTLLAGETDPERRRRLSTIVDQAFRARDLIGGLMLFARPPRPRPSSVDPDDLAAAAVDRARAQAATKRACLDYRPSGRSLVARIDAAMIDEAIRAVVANGIEAVAEGGHVTVEVLGPEGPAGAGTAGTGSCRIVVTDDGRGMDAVTVKKAFDPFFSGREAGRGAGLGLAKAWRFVEANGGTIGLESRPGVGTRVTLTLPTVRD